MAPSSGRRPPRCLAAWRPWTPTPTPPLTIIADLDGISIANSNAPNQTVIAGTEDRLEAALERCRDQGVRGQRLPVACAFHSPLVAPAREPLAQALAEARLRPPQRPVYSNMTAARYTEDADAIRGPWSII